jgi:Skp family chaperone for outer membrane proteins|tara:strand:- start:1886 stop:2443 length:558 start_codon:yes stop_codon:yes gene_type:complete
MIKINKIYTFSILILILTFNNINLFANENYPNTSIAIVDLNLILSESKAAKDATKQFEIIQKNTEEEIIKSDKEMLEERNKLIEQQSVIAPEAFELKAKDYEKKLQNYQSEKQNKLRSLEGVLQNARNDILENVKPILEELSKELGVTVILEKNSVLLSATNMDITDDVIKKLNKELPKIKVSLD